MKIPVDFTLKIKYNKPMQLTAADGSGSEITVSGAVPERAERRALDPERCADQLKKTGGTPFFVDRVDTELDDGLAAPVSELNRMRREALGELLERRAERLPIPWREAADPEFEPHRAGPMKFRARFPHANPPENAKKLELCYIPCRTDPHRLARLLEEGLPAAVELPRGMFGIEPAVRRCLENAKAAGIRDVWAGTLDSVRLALDCGFTVHGGFSLNITNTPALEFYRSLGVQDAELSFELTLREAARIGGATPRGLFLYGRLPLMLCRNCPAANSPKGCLACKAAPELTDRRGVKFPVQCYGACSEVLNSVPLSLAGRMGDVERIDFGLLRFSTEDTRQTERIIDDILNGTGSSAEPNSFTRGLYYRGFAPRREDS